MSRRFERVFPASERVLLDGGLNTKFEPTIIADNESPDCLNVVFTNMTVESRQGATKYNTTAIGSFVFDGLYVRRAQDATETMIAFAGGSAWQLAGTTFTTIASAQSVYTTAVRVGASQYENHLFASNGYIVPYKWSGADWTRHGVYPPTTTSTVASQAAGVITGDYNYKVTYMNSQSVESDVGPITATFTAAGATIRVSAIPTAAQSWGVSSRRVYRTTNGGTSFKRVATISDNTTTTYDDNTADASLGTTAPTDNGVPPYYNAVIYHQSRLFMNDISNANYVWWTGIGEPYTVATTNFKQIGDSSSDLVKAFGVYDNALVVICERTVTMVYMPSTDSSGWTWVTTRIPFGSRSPYCVIPYNDKLLFAAYQNDKFAGFAAIKGTSVYPDTSLLTIGTTGSDLKSNRIEPDMQSVNASYTGNISGITYKNRAYIALTYGSTPTTNNRVYVMDFSQENLDRPQKEAWAPWTGVNVAQFVNYAGGLYYGSSTANGFIYRLENSVYSDDGAAINAYFSTKVFAGTPSDVGYTKDHKYANLLVSNLGAYYMNLTVTADSDAGVGTTYQINLNPGGAVWNGFNWNEEVWGAGLSQQEKIQYLGGTRGTRIQFKFTNQNTANQRFKVHWLKYVYNIKGRR